MDKVSLSSSGDNALLTLLREHVPLIACDGRGGADEIGVFASSIDRGGEGFCREDGHVVCR
jgi:hypothetical protein